MDEAQITAASWYPKAIATGLRSKDEAPTGFAAYRLSTRWGSLDLFAPLGVPNDDDWWSQVTTDAGWWGNAPDLSGAEISPLASDADWAWLAKLTSGEEYEIRCLPSDEHGNGRLLAELDCPLLRSAIGGLQYHGCDIILIMPAMTGNGADVVISELVAAEDGDSLNSLAEKIGIALGQFAAVAGTAQRLPYTQRVWNDRLKKIEDLTKVNTLWRAPHSADSSGTITHRNMGLSIVEIDGEKIHFAGCRDGFFNGLLKPAKINPALRDLGAVFTSLGQHLSQLGAGHYEPGMRAALLTGWKSTAPVRWSSRSALDTHLGGVAIWEYEQHLQAMAWSQALGEKSPSHSKDWLGRVSRVQAEMFVDRIWSVAGLSALVVGLWFSLSFIFSGFDPNDLLIAFPAMLIGWLFKWKYNSRARPPERPI